jgi:hypothetical protein
MLNRVEERFDLKPDRLIGDTGDGSAELLGWMVDEKAIEPHIPLWDKTQRHDGTLSSSDFQWDAAADEYHCPQGQALRKERRIFEPPRSHITKANTIIYCASQTACATCPMKARCCPHMRKR